MIALLVAAAFAALFTLLLTPLFARLFRRLRLGQFVRADTPWDHVVKRGTPSMGGIVFIVGAILGYVVGKVTAAFVGRSVSAPEFTLAAGLVILMMVGLGAVGFIDDFLKVRKQNSLGLAGWYKILFTVIVSGVFGWIALSFSDSNGLKPASTSISFIRDITPSLISIFGVTVGTIALLLWISLITVSTTNAVNLTDGLDGLAAGASIFAIGSYIIIGFWQFNQSCLSVRDNVIAESCYTVSDPLDLATIAAAIVGALIGFLWWNTSPAQIMMGDTGSFALGGALASMAIFTRTIVLLLLIGGIFVLVALSVIVQVISFKYWGRRVFLMAPIHHHFEMKGWSETKIMVRFWIVAAILCSIGFALFYRDYTFFRR